MATYTIRTRSVRHPYTISIPNAVACTWLQPRMRGDHRAGFGRLQEHGGWREVAAGYKRPSCNDLLHGLARRNPKAKTRDPKEGRNPKSERCLKLLLPWRVGGAAAWKAEIIKPRATPWEYVHQIIQALKGRYRPIRTPSSAESSLQLSMWILPPLSGNGA